MIALENTTKARRDLARDLLPVAAQALARYCLEGALLDSMDGSGEPAFWVEVPADRPIFHPYLGLVVGERFVLRLRSSQGGGYEASRREIEWLAALLRDTDLPSPEPVPACDGALLPTMWVEGLGEMHSVLYRWVEE